MPGDSEPPTTPPEPIEPAPTPKPKRSWLARALDTAAVLVVLYAVFHFFVAPRFATQTALQAAPPLTLATLDGTEFSLAAHRGHVVFLDFWASWCEPCQQSLPLVEHFAKTHPDIDVIPVDSGEARAAASQYAQAHDMQHVALDPDTAATHAYGVGGLPTMYVIDPDGNVRAKWIGFNPAVEEEMADARVRYGKPQRASLNTVNVSALPGP